MPRCLADVVSSCGLEAQGGEDRTPFRSFRHLHLLGRSQVADKVDDLLPLHRIQLPVRHHRLR